MPPRCQGSWPKSEEDSKRNNHPATWYFMRVSSCEDLPEFLFLSQYQSEIDVDANAINHEHPAKDTQPGWSRAVHDRINARKYHEQTIEHPWPPPCHQQINRLSPCRPGARLWCCMDNSLQLDPRVRQPSELPTAAGVPELSWVSGLPTQLRTSIGHHGANRRSPKRRSDARPANDGTTTPWKRPFVPHHESRPARSSWLSNGYSRSLDELKASRGLSSGIRRSARIGAERLPQNPALLPTASWSARTVF